MAAGRLFVPNYMPAEDANGDRIANARLYFYDYDGEATTTLKLVYTTADLDVELSNPVVADVSGVFPAIWADTEERFTVAVTDGEGAPIVTYDAVSPSIDATLASVALAESAADSAEAFADDAEASALRAEAAAANVTGEPFSFTSASSNTITVASKTFVAEQAGSFFYEGQYAVAAVVGASENQMIGRIDAVTEDGDGYQTLTIDMSTATAPGGVGPYSGAGAWRVSLAASGGVLSLAGETGIVTAAEAKTALAIASTDVTDFNTAVDNRAAALAIALRRRS